MTLRLSLAAVAAAAVAAVALSLTARADDKESKAIELFNGKNLDGWKAIDNGKGDAKADARKTWSVNAREKTLVCKGEPFGYAITDKDYGDYKLELEWRYANTDKDFKGRRNSGVLLHCKGETKPWPNCFEAQLLAGSAGELWLMGCKAEGPKEQKDEKSSAHWFRKKTDKEVEKPLGELNKYEITCKGDSATFVINGQKVNEVKKSERTRGRIALQSEGAEIHFRNFKLTPLK